MLQTDFGYSNVGHRRLVFPSLTPAFFCHFSLSLFFEQLPGEQLSEYENLQLPKHRAKQSRFYNHVVLSESSRTALKNVIRVKRASLAAAALLAATTLLISCTLGASPLVTAGAGAGAARATTAGALSKRGWAGIVAAVGGAVALGLSAAAQKLEGHFYKNFERHPVLG